MPPGRIKWQLVSDVIKKTPCWRARSGDKKNEKLTLFIRNNDLLFHVSDLSFILKLKIKICSKQRKGALNKG